MENRAKPKLSWPKKITLICFLLAADLYVLNLGYVFWAADKNTPILKTLGSSLSCNILTARKRAAQMQRTVKGIVHRDGKPAALIGRQLVNEGQTIEGVEVVKINKRDVEFRKNCKSWKQKVGQEPDRKWAE